MAGREPTGFEYFTTSFIGTYIAHMTSLLMLLMQAVPQGSPDAQTLIKITNEYNGSKTSDSVYLWANCMDLFVKVSKSDPKFNPEKLPVELGILNTAFSLTVYLRVFMQSGFDDQKVKEYYLKLTKPYEFFGKGPDPKYSSDKYGDARNMMLAVLAIELRQLAQELQSWGF